VSLRPEGNPSALSSSSSPPQGGLRGHLLREALPHPNTVPPPLEASQPSLLPMSLICNGSIYDPLTLGGHERRRHSADCLGILNFDFLWAGEVQFEPLVTLAVQCPNSPTIVREDSRTAVCPHSQGPVCWVLHFQPLMYLQNAHPCV
jgi:hypothetical protein